MPQESLNLSCPCCCAGQAALGEIAWGLEQGRGQGWCPEFPMLGKWGCTFGAVLCWLPRSFRPGRGFLQPQWGPGRPGCGWLPAGSFYGNFFVAWYCFTTSFLCISTPGGTLLPSQNHCEGPSYLLEKHLIPHRKIIKFFSAHPCPSFTCSFPPKSLDARAVSCYVGYDLVFTCASCVLRSVGRREDFLETEE